jgi:hypothetical protein
MASDGYYSDASRRGSYMSAAARRSVPMSGWNPALWQHVREKTIVCNMWSLPSPDTICLGLYEIPIAAYFEMELCEEHSLRSVGTKTSTNPHIAPKTYGVFGRGHKLITSIGPRSFVQSIAASTPSLGMSPLV